MPSNYHEAGGLPIRFAVTAVRGSAAAGELTKIKQAANTYSWSLEVISEPSAIMATRESGQIGEPWVVMVTPGSRGMQVSFYRPGDALDAEGDDVGGLTGNPREMGRQLRSILEDLADGAAADS